MRSKALISTALTVAAMAPGASANKIPPSGGAPVEQPTSVSAHKTKSMIDYLGSNAIENPCLVGTVNISNEGDLSYFKRTIRASDHGKYLFSVLYRRQTNGNYDVDKIFFADMSRDDNTTVESFFEAQITNSGGIRVAEATHRSAEDPGQITVEGSTTPVPGERPIYLGNFNSWSAKANQMLFSAEVCDTPSQEPASVYLPPVAFPQHGYRIQAF